MLLSVFSAIKFYVSITELPEDQKREHEIQQAKEGREKIKVERAVLEKKREERRKKKKGVYAFEVGR
jgi:hypothetical protein